MMANRIKEIFMPIIKFMYNIIISFLQWFLIETLKCGPIPKHVSFIIDGNRRWARNHNMETFNGHEFGVGAIDRVIIL